MGLGRKNGIDAVVEGYHTVREIVQRYRLGWVRGLGSESSQSRECYAGVSEKSLGVVREVSRMAQFGEWLQSLDCSFNNSMHSPLL
ncbi:hypothetical protein Tco_1539608 [Tanacetum coccineum]